ncbi:MAG: hypothetical protein QOG20_6707 [Pseudonocardiales bacterium]|jgi:hypothetical protein|nr:hypothetical protein [Pseudonocardiales bacterium]
MIASVMRPWIPVDSGFQRDTAGQPQKRSLTGFSLVRGSFCGVIPYDLRRSRVPTVRA